MFGSKDPGKEKKAAHWSVEKLRDPDNMFGWIAGKMIGVYVHTLPPSKPCYEEMTDGDLRCPYHHVRPQIDWIGYLPIYREGGKPIVVTINHAHKPEIDQLRLHQPVKLKRGKGKFDTIVVEPSKWSKVYQPGNSGRHMSADIRAWLMNTLWKEGELIQYFARHGEIPPLESLSRWEDDGQQRPGSREDLKAGQGAGLAARFARGPQPEDKPLPPTMADVIPILNGKLNHKD